MYIQKTAKRILRSAAQAFAALTLVFCVNGTLRFCFCDPDPDGCGEHCHDCSEAPEEECVHVMVQLDRPMAAADTVETPRAFAALPVVRAPEILPTGVCLRRIPLSTGPPDPVGAYISNSTRLYPRS